MRPQTGERTVGIWCARCKAYVPVTGPTYTDGAQAPVHITPAVLAQHRHDDPPETTT